ncbi:MAG TPA: zf-HC2 domain-containing protein [Terriglobales bacterium]|nr:zf-HC2 domain-containing protein [Terriglobales bacterium]
MVVNCEHVWREVSNYLDGEIDAATRAAMEEHLKICKHCTAVLDGTRNVVQLYGDDRLFELPAGFSRRLQKRLTQGTSSGWLDNARTFWMLAVAAVALVAGGVSLGNSSFFRQPDVRSPLAQSPHGIPASLIVTVSSEGRVFHVPGCKFIHRNDGDHLESMTAEQAMKRGYVPCSRCLRQYLSAEVECPRAQPPLVASFDRPAELLPELERGRFQASGGGF